MRIFYGLDGVEIIKNPIVTIGTFDGVHLGHQKILQNLVGIAKEVGGESVLFTFYPHPRMVLFPDSHNLKLLQTQEEKLKKLASTGIDHIIVFPFTFEFSRLTAMEFIRDILVNKLNLHSIVIGYDHQFGRNREGNIQYLKDISNTYSFNAVEIPAHEIDEVNVSSTKIRKAIEAGNIEIANQYLGEPFIISGKVISGQQLGRKIGFPTANIELTDQAKIVPANGVYIVKVQLNKKFLKGLMNIGNRPSISENLQLQLEIHLFDFKDDIYGIKLEVQVLKKIRNEIKFENLDLLIEQINQDKLSANHFFSIS